MPFPPVRRMAPNAKMPTTLNSGRPSRRCPKHEAGIKPGTVQNYLSVACRHGVSVIGAEILLGRRRSPTFGRWEYQIVDTATGVDK